MARIGGGGGVVSCGVVAAARRCNERSRRSREKQSFHVRITERIYT
jgi:hypothetical protein